MKPRIAWLLEPFFAYGARCGHIFHTGKLSVNTQIAAYYNVVHPDNGANWQARLQVQLLFPK